MSKIEKAVLLAGYLPTEDVELPSGQGTVTVRGLTRHEAVETQRGIKQGDDDDEASAVLEARAIARGMVDPKLTEEEVQAWRVSAVAADIAAVAKRISELSNLDKSGGKGPTSNSRRTKG